MVNLQGLSAGHEAHFHPETLEICFVKKGYLQWWLADETFDIHAGDIVTMPPGIPHGSTDSTLQPCEYYAVHLYPDSLDPVLRQIILDKSFGGHHPERTRAGDLLRLMFEEHLNRPFAWEASCQALLSLLIVSVAREINASEGTHPARNLVSRAMRLMAAAEEKTIAEISDELKVSPVWLTKCFKQELGQTPGEWILSRRLVEAKHRIAQTEAPIFEIAIMLGFSSSQYFATAFRRQTGLTPSEYRDRARKQPGLSLYPSETPRTAVSAIP